jgi:EAL domain-containing protein (putative c-di-GMP-specific phosphodiesterase class I)
MDRRPRKLTAEQRRLLAGLGKAVENWLANWADRPKSPAAISPQRPPVPAPMSQEDAAGADPSPLSMSLPPPLTTMSCGIVLLDDDPIQLGVLHRQIEALGGAPIHGFSSGEAALQWLQGCETVSMLFMLDLEMAEMDGVEVLRRLAQGGYAGAVALVSGAEARVLDTAGRLARAHGLGLLGNLRKPVGVGALAALLDRWRDFVPPQARRDVKTYDSDDLGHAIEAGQILLHYQPKVYVKDGTVAGVEALVRWQHPTDGLVYPEAFIGAAETHGLIDRLTRSVLGQALAQAKRWRDAGRPLRVAVNISMDNLSEVDFAQFVVNELKHHEVPANQLVLEVTESRLSRDEAAPLATLTRLRMHRVGLSIDDFGTGHSLLAQLRDLPFDELKIDRGFVHGSSEHLTQRAIFIASLLMAQQLGMSAVAEGVEERVDWEFVRAAGCDMAQGFYIGHPIAAEAIDAWRDEWRQRFATGR